MLAVESDAKKTLVVSVPGSGKTTVLVARIREMIRRGVRPEDITAITFTRYAAEEIRRRLGDGGRGVWVGTLHALALRIVRASGDVSGYADNWLSVISDDEAAGDLHLCLRDVGLVTMRMGKVCWGEVTAGAWEDFVGRVCSGALNEEADKDAGHEAMWRAWNLYLGRLRSQNTLTFGTMLVEALRVLEDRKMLLYWRSAVRHVLVDEAQDTSNVQWSIVWRLVDKTNPDTLFVVGDDDQSLYGWRGAVPDAMVAMSKPESGFWVVKMSRCYRFGEGIAGPARSLISNNANRIEKGLVPCGAFHGMIHVTLDGSVEFVAEMIATLLRGSGMRLQPDDIVVLARTHAVLEDVQAALERVPVPCVKAGRLGGLRKTFEFRAVLSYLRLMDIPWDKRSFAGICASEQWSHNDVLAIRERANAEGIPLLQASGRLADVSGLRGEQFMRRLADYLASRDPHHSYVEATRYLMGVAFMYGLSSPRDLLDWVAMADVQDDVRVGAEGRVTLATIHAAKGLEWPVVFLVGMNDGLLPTLRTSSDPEEERRLCYVAVTRASSEVHLVHLGDSRRAPMPSRFLSEMNAGGQRREP